ncbi:MAG TPA: hypothetical protein VH418_21745 [Solirubrobacteraceae bacterium]|jgi:hypothetical protein
MQVISHQTVKLGRGRHVSPDSGMCVMELASVLAGERFSDHPQSVCPVIGALLRGYNDLTDHEHRQALIPYAAQVVGTTGSAAVRRARAERCRVWGAEIASRAPRRHWRRRRLGRRPAPFAGSGAACGAWAMRVLPHPAHTLQDEVFALLDELIAMGGRDGGEQLAPVAPAATAVWS